MDVAAEEEGKKYIERITKVDDIKPENKITIYETSQSCKNGTEKSKKWGKYSKKFKSEWLEDPALAEWVKRVDDVTKVICRFCHTHLRAHKSDLKKHMNSSKHKKAITCSEPSVETDDPIILNIDCYKKDAIKHELILAAYAGCHSVGSSIAHLTQVCNRFLDPSKQISLNPSKCAIIVKKCIAPHLLEELLKDLKGAKYSLILDASVNMACGRFLCVCVRYFSKQFSLIMSQFLGLIALKSTNIASAYEQLKDFLSKNGIDLSMCIAIALDGASGLSGNPSLFSLLKADVPNLYLIKCISHSLQLACSVAAEKLPMQIDYMIRETFNWFHRSAMMKQEYDVLYKAINDQEEPLQLVPLSGNRWVTRCNSVHRILEQYNNLAVHFRNDMPHDRYLSEQLRALYNDPNNRLYLVFLIPILQEFEDMNILFKEDNLDFCIALSKFQKFVLRMLRRVIAAEHVALDVNLALSSIYLPMSKVDYGCEFLSLLMHLTNNELIPDQDALDIKENCLNFLKEVCQQLQLRISEKGNVLFKVENLSPAICLSHTRPPFLELPLEFANENKLDNIQNEWGQLLYIDWSSHLGTVPKDGQTFWCKVATALDESGNQVLQHLSEFALTVYSLPVSNAAIEKIFSKASLLKTKLGSQLDIELLAALLRIKSCFSAEQECCFNLEPSDTMIKDMLENRNHETSSQDCLDTLNTFSAEAYYHLHL